MSTRTTPANIARHHGGTSRVLRLQPDAASSCVGLQPEQLPVTCSGGSLQSRASRVASDRRRHAPRLVRTCTALRKTNRSPRSRPRSAFQRWTKNHVLQAAGGVALFSAAALFLVSARIVTLALLTLMLSLLAATLLLLVAGRHAVSLAAVVIDEPHCAAFSALWDLDLARGVSCGA